MSDDIRGYRCPNCGAMIPIRGGRVLKCECCGTEFERTSENQPYRIVTFNGEDIVIGQRICGQEMDFFRREGSAEYMLQRTLHEMAHDLAEKILPYISYDVSEDVLTSGVVIRAKVRVGNPVQPLGMAYVHVPVITDEKF